MGRKPKQIKFVEPHWNDLVSVYFMFCREHFHEEPSFDGSSPRDLKYIVVSLRERAEKSNIAWDLPTATKRLYKFLEFAYKDSWLRKNWILSNINRQKDKIFFLIRAAFEQSVNPFKL